MDCCHRYFVLKRHRKYGIIKAWKNIDGAVGNTNVCRVNNGLQPINKRLKEQLIVTAMKKRRLRRTCDKAGSPWAVLGETAWQIDSAVPFFCFHLFLFVLLRIFAQLAIVTILLLTPTRISGCRRFYVLCGIRYPFTRMFDQRCLPRKLLFCFCQISGVPETVVPFPPGQRDR